jgi:hypothetical protein
MSNRVAEAKAGGRLQDAITKITDATTTNRFICSLDNFAQLGDGVEWISFLTPFMGVTSAAATIHGIHSE